MTVTVQEKLDSLSTVDAQSIDRTYVIVGTTSDTEAMAKLKETAPLLYNGLVRKRCRVEPQGENVWLGTAPYAPAAAVKKEPLQAGQSSYNFDTGGGTQHITQSLQTMGRYAPAGKTAPDFEGAIGYDGKSVQGVDITVPVFSWTETHCLPPENVTWDYVVTLFGITGKVNTATFRGFAAGEVLFLGAAGSRRGDDNWEITYRFAASPNRTNITVGSITVTAKKGWEYLWVLYDQVEDNAAKQLIKKPIAAYVEKVYETANYAGLAIPEPQWN